MDNLLKPDRFDIHPSAPEADRLWTHWLKNFNNYLSSLTEEPGINKLSLLVNHVSFSIYEYIMESPTYEHAIQILQNLYVKPTNDVFARHKILSRQQQHGETLDQYLSSIKLLSEECTFQAVTVERCRDDFLRDAFINGLNSAFVKQRLVENKSLDLQVAYDQARSWEQVQAESYPGLHAENNANNTNYYGFKGQNQQDTVNATPALPTTSFANANVQPTVATNGKNKVYPEALMDLSMEPQNKKARVLQIIEVSKPSTSRGIPTASKTRRPKVKLAVTQITGFRSNRKCYYTDDYFAFMILKKTKRGNHHLKCRSQFCNVKANLCEDDMIQMTGTHNHQNDYEYVQSSIFLAILKERAASEDGTLKELYDDEVKKLQDTEAPSYESVEALMLRSRLQNRPCNAQNPEEGGEANKDKDKEVLVEKEIKQTVGLRSGSKIFYTVEDYFVFLVAKVRPDGNHYLKCRNKYCKVKATICELNKIQMNGTHLHTNDYNYIQVCDFLNIVKNRVMNETSSLRIIYNEEVVKMQGIEVPPFSSVESTMFRIRSRNKPRDPNDPKTMVECILSCDGDNIGGAKASLKKMDQNSLQKLFVSKQVVEQCTGYRSNSRIFYTHDYYVFLVSKNRKNGHHYLRCRNHACKVKANVIGENILQIHGFHQHQNEYSYIQICKLFMNLKTRAKNESTALRNIYNEEAMKLQGIDIPKFRKVESTLFRIRSAKRRNGGAAPPTPPGAQLKPPTDHPMMHYGTPPDLNVANTLRQA